MTGRESLDLEELRLKKHEEQGGRCWVCHGTVQLSDFQLAHRIPQRKWAIMRFGKAVIHHPRNMVGVCSLYCNSRAQLNPNGKQVVALASEILDRLYEG